MTTNCLSNERNYFYFILIVDFFVITDHHEFV